MAPDRESRKKLITAQRQGQILKAALEVFSAKGYSAATIPAIAKSAGIAAGTIYLYYPSKRDLFIAVIESLMISPLSNIFKQACSENFQVTLNQVLKDRMRFFKSDSLPGFTSLMGEIQRDPELRTLYLTKILRPFMTGMEEFYAQRINSGEFRQINPALAVRLVGSLMIGMTMLTSLERSSSPLNKIPQEKLTAEIINFILFGLTKKDTTGPVKKEKSK
jgi:TetR/AcrR family transcriptional regulator